MKDPGDIREVFDPKDYANYNHYSGTIMEDYFSGGPSTRGGSIWDWISLAIPAVALIVMIVLTICHFVH